ncbi:MAG: DUF2752 domain-containing protein [Lachnospiraceae bacterium]|nr:DUF2752 domain-containing protein [Lachnospiraceae bacterium]
MNKADKIFYILGLILFFFLALTSILQQNGLFVLTEIGFPCSFRLVTGYYCPGCGGTHAICALAAGNIKESFFYHPVVLYTAACFFLFLFRNTLAFFWNKQTGRQKLPVMHFRTAYIYIGIGLIFLQWIVKNLVLIYS